MAKNMEHEKYAYLDRFSTEQLEELLRADIESSEDGDEGVIFHILEVMEQREKEHPTGRLPDADEMWAEFQQYYNIPEGEGLSLYPCMPEDEEEGQASDPMTRPVRRFRPALKLAGIVAAVVAALFALMICAQAAGFDVFGAIGRWTDETFRFVPNSAAGYIDIKSYEVVDAALDACGIAENFAPTWYPAGYEAGEPQIFDDKTGKAVNIAFYGEDERFFVFDVTRNQPSPGRGSFIFEKDDSPVELYTGGGRTFYIMSNLDTMTATWSDGATIITIAGSLTTDEIKSMIDSMGGEAS